MKYNVKLSADDKPLFMVVHGPNSAAGYINHDLDQIALWAIYNNLSIAFNPLKQAVELVFSKKEVKTNHPVILSNSSSVSTVDEHKHLGIILDSKVSFSPRIQVGINKARKVIGMLRFISKYLLRHTLNDLYKL